MPFARDPTRSIGAYAPPTRENKAPAATPSSHRHTGHSAPSLPSRHTATQEPAMSEENPKTALDHVGDTLSQLKEMRHYSKNNVERLTTQWLLFDGELSKLGKAKVIEPMMELQGQLHDALEAAITDLEALVVELTPAPEEET